MNRNQLRSILVSEGFRQEVYDLNGGTPEDKLCLEDRGYAWFVYYSERGQRFDEVAFSNEGDACEYLLQQLRRVPSTKDGVDKEYIERPKAY